MIKCILSVIPFFIFVNACIAQKPGEVRTDSAKGYKSIEKFSKRSTLSKMQYRIVFKSTLPPSRKKKKTRLEQRYYHNYEGKIIRNILISTLDPFGYSVKDTAISPEGFLKRAGYSLHVKTLPLAVRNLLLFKKNDAFDSLKVKESERLIRSQQYVREVFLYPVNISKGSDSVDIIIRVLDLWTIVPNMGISPQ